ncbi:MAG: 30S ribosome-binding factor RbfA [Dehalococcoidales bacterium]|nr:MAG: 30S ribosome-binding factor RbfA [Dehalococcoidales bacterium]
MAYHIERVNSLIRQEISELLRCQVKDPRLDTFITVTAVDTSSDMRHAKVFVSRLGGQEDKHKTLGVLASAAGFFRRELAARLKLRRVPELNFQWDDSLERGDRLLQLIDRVTEDEDHRGRPFLPKD